MNETSVYIALLQQFNLEFRWLFPSNHTSVEQIFIISQQKAFHNSTVIALASVAQLVGALSQNQKVEGLIPGQRTYLGCRSYPGLDAYGRQSILLFCIDVPLPPSLPSPPSKSNEKNVLA